MKKNIIAVISVIGILIIGIFVYFNFIKESTDSSETAFSYTTDQPQEQETETSVTISLAPAVTMAPTPAVTTQVTPTVEVSDNNLLLPAFTSVKGQKEYGYINGEGEFIIEPQYNMASGFTDCVSVINDFNKYKVINTKGEVLFQNDDTIDTFHNGAASFLKYTDGQFLKLGFIDTTGKVIVEPQYLLVSRFNQDKQAYVKTAEDKYAKIDKNGNILESYEINPGYENTVAITDNGYIIYTVQDTDQFTLKEGVISVNGDVILQPNYGEVKYLGGGLFSVKQFKEMSYTYPDDPAAIFNSEGMQLTDYTLYDLSEFTDGYASATDDTTTFFIGTDGKKVTTLPQFEGRGTLILLGDMIKADIDNDLIYQKMDGTILWQNDNTNNLGGGVTVKAIKFKTNKYVSVKYPEVNGLTDLSVQSRINDKLKNIFTANRINPPEGDLAYGENTTVEDSFIAELINNLLIINKNGYDYPLGAAHGMPIKEYYYINITNGDFYGLSDLFTEGSDYVSKLSTIVGEDIKAESDNANYMVFPDQYKGIAADQPFALSTDMLSIYFLPYDIAAYAAGFPQFDIPLDQLSDIINRNGDFWKAFH